MKLKGIKLKGFDVKDGKVAEKKRRLSVSQHIRQRSSTKTKPTRRTP